VPAVLQFRYYYDKYNTLPYLPCYIYTTTTTTTTRCREFRATTALLILQLHFTAMPAVMPAVLLPHYYSDNYNTLPCPPWYYYISTTTTTTLCRARRATTILLLRQLQHAPG